MKKITSILMVVIGLVVIVLGASFQPEATSYDLTEKTFKYAAENSTSGGTTALSRRRA